MNIPLIVVFLPYLVSILLKVAQPTLDRKLMMNALEDLAALPKPSASSMDLSLDVREILLRHLFIATFKSTAILTAITSSFNAFLIIWEMQMSTGSLTMLVLLLVVGISLVGWLLPKKVHHFSTQLEIKAVAAFCTYDLLLAGLSLWKILNISGAGTGGPL